MKSQINKQCIFIHSGTVVKDNETQKWRTTNFKEKDQFGTMGDRLRVEAAILLFKENPESRFIAVAGKGQLSDIPDIAAIKDIIKSELVEAGVPEGKIIAQGDAGNTYQELLELEKIIASGEIDGNIVLLSNRWHLPRVQAIIKAKFDFGKLGVRLRLRSAEEILIEKEPTKWSKIIEEAYNDEAMGKRLETENRGIKQIKDGTYKFI